MYGYMARKVPAHMPHFIDRQIMRKLQSKFSNEYARTSANRFRSSDDMQYAFAYYYYVMSELEEFNETKLFEEIDLNMNGRLDASEIMVMNLRINPKPFSVNYRNLDPQAPLLEMLTLNSDFALHLNNCLANASADDASGKVFISKSQFRKCTSLVEFLR